MAPSKMVGNKILKLALQSHMGDLILLTMGLLGHLEDMNSQELWGLGKVIQGLQKLLIVTYFRQNLNLSVGQLLTVCT
jgi:hypothetical protein